MIRKLLICIWFIFLGVHVHGWKDLDLERQKQLLSVLRQAVSHQLKNDQARYRYIYEEQEVIEELIDSDKIKHSVTKTYTWFHTELSSFSKLISINGARYDSHYLKAQNKAIRKSVAKEEGLSLSERNQKLIKTRRKREGEMQTALFRNLLAAFSFAPQKSEYVNGSETMVLVFRPKISFKPPNARVTFLLSLKGKLWITKGSNQLIRLTGTLSNDVKYLGGLFGSLKKGATFTLEQADIGNGLWFPTFSTVTYKRSLLFKGAHKRQTSLYSHYRLNPFHRRSNVVQVENLK